MQLKFSEELNKFQIYKNLERMKLELIGYYINFLSNGVYVDMLLYDEKMDKIVPVFASKMSNEEVVLPSILKTQKKYVLISTIKRF
ncbi:MAG: hypothetical protein N2Z80_00305 [Hydrogenothermaceae bacterium]|nr:hypothetical protein [Hydrogenothermaceae bacterium]